MVLGQRCRFRVEGSGFRVWVLGSRARSSESCYQALKSSDAEHQKQLDRRLSHRVVFRFRDYGDGF